MEGDIDEVDASKAPLLEHLIELRARLIKSVLALVIGAIACIPFLPQILAFLLSPFRGAVAKYNAAQIELGNNPIATDLIATQILETFFVNVKLAVFGGIILAFPVIAFQVYRFVAPGLYKHERGAFLPYLILSPLLFSLGAALVFYYVFPYVLSFGLNVAGSGDISLLPKISEYLSLAMTLFIAFGLSFQLPVVLSLLGRAGIVNSAGLKKGRRYAVVGIAAFAAFVTPPDPMTQIVLGGAIYLLYEISIISVRLIEKKADEGDADEVKSA
ncbi:twin-arginine translocase subunit TatC [Fretibacter rubidus]|uniref:twin-arginine translocase subunit TatC n=1 Tax=Fretibacter rubidus TaxID=570162 RepID=UPI00352B9424